MITKNRIGNPKYEKAASKIQSMWRRRKFRIAAYALMTKKRQGDPKFDQAATMIQCLFRRRKARKVVDQIIW